MIISEKQILTLLRISECYCAVLHATEEHKAVEEIQNFLATINEQQSEELKEIK